MRQGFAAMSTVLIISAVAMAVITTTVLLAIGSGQTSLALLLGEGNLQQVEGCAEDVIENVRDNSAFNKTSITRPEGMCSMTYNSGGPVNWDVTISMTQGDYTRKVRVVFGRNATSITRTSWQEI